MARTHTMSAPRSTACDIGVLLTTPPSMWARPSMVTGGSTPGMAAEARIVSAATPWESSTPAPVRRSVATTWKGTGASCRFSKRRCSASSRRSPLLATRWSLRPAKPSSPRSGCAGNTSVRRSVRHTVASSCRGASAATQAPLRAPTEAPMTRSARSPASARAVSMPTCVAPRLAPPESTNAVVIAQSRPRSRKASSMPRWKVG